MAEKIFIKRLPGEDNHFNKGDEGATLYFDDRKEIPCELELYDQPNAPVLPTRIGIFRLYSCWWRGDHYKCLYELEEE